MINNNQREGVSGVVLLDHFSCSILVIVILNEVANGVILWEPKHVQRSRGRPAKNYIDILAADMDAGSSGLLELMESQEQWKTIGNSARSRSTE